MRFKVMEVFVVANAPSVEAFFKNPAAYAFFALSAPWLT